MQYSVLFLWFFEAQSSVCKLGVGVSKTATAMAAMAEDDNDKDICRQCDQEFDTQDSASR